MATKNHSNESGNSDRTAAPGLGGGIDPEDDITSEITGLLDEELGAGEAGKGRDVAITDTDLAAHVEPKAEETLVPGYLLSGRFEIVCLVHSGGMGHVYKAIDRHRHPEGSGPVHVAIKMLRESLSHRDDFRMALEREASKAQILSHPNIINIFDFDAHDGRFYLVMEWLEGESVNTLLRRSSGQRLAPELSWPIIEGAAAAARHAHANNVVHADINPSNIFITTTKDIKLLDFGVARYTDELRDPAEDRIAWVTQTYASPEVLSGMTPTVADDVFSLGCVAYRLLSGKHPFGGSPSIVAKRNGMQVEPIPGLPESEWQVLSRALAYTRAERPGSVGVFLRADQAAQRAPRFAGLVRKPFPMAAAVAIALTVTWLLWRDGSQPAAPGDISATPAAAQQARPPAPATESADAAMAELISAAAQAMAERRLVLPENDNARDLYRELLRLEPGNPEALRGLRDISDEFVARADAALKNGNPRAAAAALSVAAETDAGNPAIGIVSGFLVAQGDAQLTAARLAAGEGDSGRAMALLDEAAQYAHIDAAEIDAVREQIAGTDEEAVFLDALATADSHIAAGRLTGPAGANARAVLAALQRDYGDDPRLRAARERVAERLLTRAAFAAAAGQVAEAEDFIREADSLGVLATEIEVARSSLAVRAGTGEAPVGSATTAAAAAGDAADPVQTAASETAGPQTESIATQGDAGVSGTAAGQPTAMRMEDLGIERFVAPTYPRGPQRRGVTGFVDLAFDVNPDGRTSAIEIVRAVPGDVFDRSATEAVRQWRFAPRDDTVRANVTLRFEIAR